MWWWAEGRRWVVVCARRGEQGEGWVSCRASKASREAARWETRQALASWRQAGDSLEKSRAQASMMGSSCASMAAP